MLTLKEKIMGSKTTSLSSESTIGVPSGTSAITDNTQPVGSESTTTTAPMLLDVLTGMKSASRMDAAALDYVENLNKIFNDDKSEDISSIPITTDRVEARVFVHNASRAAIILVFGDTYETMDKTPPSTYFPNVMAAATARDTSLQIVQCITVIKQDYPLAGKMASFISNAFKTITSTAAVITADSFKGLKIVAITNIDMVRDYVARISPHAIPERDDIGVLLCVETSEPNPSGIGHSVTQKPFLAVTGYTRMFNPQNSTGARYIPVPTITSVMSIAPNPSLLAMALPMATDAFIMYGIWQRPYQTFKTGAPNLGNLIIDNATKKPLFTDTIETFHQFVNTYMTMPYMAIDITEGRARALGIENIINNWSSVDARIRAFLKQPAATNISPDDAIPAFVNYNGYFLDKGVYKDTRYVDYLELAAKVTNHKQIDKLLLQPVAPGARIEDIQAMFPEQTKALYTTTTVIFGAQTMCNIAAGVANSGITIQYDTPASGNVNLGGMFTPTGNVFNNFPLLNTARQQYQYNTGFNPIYANLI